MKPTLPTPSFDGYDFTFTVPAAHLRGVIERFFQLDEQIRRYRSDTKPAFSLVVFFLIAALVLSVMVLPLPQRNILPGLSILGAIFIVLGLPSWDYLCRPSPSRITFRTMVIFVGTLIMVGQTAYGLTALPRPDSTRALAIYVLTATGGALIPGSIAILMYRRRLKLVTPDDMEIQYISQLVQPLAKELPTNLSCTLRLNPFLGRWSTQTVAGWEIRELLSFLVTPEPSSTLALSITHYSKQHRSSKGKFKGFYRQALLYRLAYQHPLLESLSPDSLMKIEESLAANIRSTTKADVSVEEDAWKELAEFPKQAVKASNKALTVRVTSKAKQRTPHLTQTDLLAPADLLSVVKALTGTLADYNPAPPPS